MQPHTDFRQPSPTLYELQNAQRAILFQCDSVSAVELVWFSLGSFELDLKAGRGWVVVWLPLAKLAWLVIDTSYPDPELSYEVIINRIDIKGGTLGLKLLHPMVF